MADNRFERFKRMAKDEFDLTVVKCDDSKSSQMLLDELKTELEVMEDKQNILKNNKLSDMEKLKMIFDISKDSLRNYDIYLYYAILAVLDKEKKPNASDYFDI